MRSAIVLLVAVFAVLGGTQTSATLLSTAAALDAITLEQVQVRPSGQLTAFRGGAIRYDSTFTDRRKILTDHIRVSNTKASIQI